MIHHDKLFLFRKCHLVNLRMNPSPSGSSSVASPRRRAASSGFPALSAIRASKNFLTTPLALSLGIPSTGDATPLCVCHRPSRGLGDSSACPPPFAFLPFLLARFMCVSLGNPASWYSGCTPVLTSALGQPVSQTCLRESHSWHPHRDYPKEIARGRTVSEWQATKWQSAKKSACRCCVGDRSSHVELISSIVLLSGVLSRL